MNYNKCEKCGKRFKAQEWKEGREREICFTCCVREKFVKEKLIDSIERMEKLIKGLEYY